LAAYRADHTEKHALDRATLKYEIDERDEYYADGGDVQPKLTMETHRWMPCQLIDPLPVRKNQL